MGNHSATNYGPRNFSSPVYFDLSGGIFRAFPEPGMLDTLEFAEVLRAGVLRSGLANGKPPAEAGYVSLAGSILEYLKENLEVTVPQNALSRTRAQAGEVRCHVR
jgi:hypothetical protein